MGTVCWDSKLNEGPTEPHLWRQSDCVSLTQYYANGTPFFEPEMHSRIGDDGRSGKTVAEFPIIYYVIGKIWSVTGVQFWIFRLFNGLFCVVAMMCLYRTLQKITGSWFWSALGPFLLLASPVYAFYGIGFLTNIPALNTVIVAWYFIQRYYGEQKMKHLVWAAVFFSLAGLLKVSAMTSYLMLLFVLGLELIRIGKFKKEGKFFPKPFVAAAVLIVPLIICLCWYLGFVESYCNEHAARYSFTSPVPVWEADEQLSTRTLHAWFTYTAYQIYPPYVWFFFIAGMLFLITQFRRINLFWIIAMPVVFIGHAMFSMLFFFCLDGHDYYHIDLLIFFVITYAAMAKYIAEREENKIQTRMLRVVAAAGMTWCVLSSGANINLRYHGCYDKCGYYEMFANQTTIDLLNLYHSWDVQKEPYPHIGDELTRRGFGDTTIVIAANDVSFNSLLVKLNRPGFTGMADFQLDSLSTQGRIERGAEILIVENPEQEQRGINKFMDYLLFREGNIGVYDLRPYKSRQ